MEFWTVIIAVAAVVALFSGLQLRLFALNRGERRGNQEKMNALEDLLTEKSRRWDERFDAISRAIVDINLKLAGEYTKEDHLERERNLDRKHDANIATMATQASHIAVLASCFRSRLRSRSRWSSLVYS